MIHAYQPIGLVTEHQPLGDEPRDQLSFQEGLVLLVLQLQVHEEHFLEG